MTQGFRQSMAWLHGWAGLLMGWLLYAIFLSGTLAYFQDEITGWMQPEPVVAAQPAAAASAAAHFLQQRVPDAKSWYIGLPTDRKPISTVFWEPAGTKRVKHSETTATLDGLGRPVTMRATKGGDFFYRFHYDLHYLPIMWGRYLVGIAAMAMLIAILSGIVTHKKIFADFFMFRLGKGQRSWLDAHNITAVLALPFHLMITYTGLVLLQVQYMPWGIAASYSAPQTYFDKSFPAFMPVEPIGKAAPLMPLGPIVERAERLWGRPAGSVRVAAPGDRNARIIVMMAQSGSLGARSRSLTFAGTDGTLVADNRQGPVLTTAATFMGLHTGRIAQWDLRWLYMLSGIGGTMMIATGLLLWTTKRRRSFADPARHFGFQIVARSNIAVVAGLPAGAAAYFLANRLLPLDMAERANWEVHCLFLVWLGVLVLALLRPERRAWREVLSFAALLYAAVPLVDLVTSPRPPLHEAWNGRPLFLIFDIVMALVALLFAFAAHKAGADRDARVPREATALGAQPVAR